jgi:hypothetical protein
MNGGVVILVSNKINFKIKEYDKRAKENFIKVKGLIHEEDNHTKYEYVYFVADLQSI